MFTVMSNYILSVNSQPRVSSCSKKWIPLTPVLDCSFQPIRIGSRILVIQSLVGIESTDLFTAFLHSLTIRGTTPNEK